MILQDNTNKHNNNSLEDYIKDLEKKDLPEICNLEDEQCGSCGS